MGNRVELHTATGCDDWEGWVIDGDGTLHAPDTWRRGFTVHDIRAWFFLTQRARALEFDVRQLSAELQQALNEKAAAEQRAAFYRQQCILESRLGLALTRIAG